MAWLTLVMQKWGAKAAPSVCGQTAPLPSPKASHSRQHISTLPSKQASIWCFLNYILSSAHDARCAMCLIQASAELQLYCAAPYTHPKCCQAPPTQASPWGDHISPATPWIDMLDGTMDMYVSREV